MSKKTALKDDLTLIDPALSHSGGARLGTLVMIRWMAVCGQLMALATVHFFLGFDVRPELTLPVVMASAIMNLWFSLRADTNTRLTDTQSAAHLTFDLLHLAVLLFLTGGLTNPFAVLMLAPPSVSASILGQRSTKFLIAASIGLVTGLAFTPFPLPWHGPPPLVEPLIMIGIWISLCFTLIFLALYMARLGREGRDRARALAATRAALEQEQRLSELGTLAAAAAHELGTPLGTILLVSKELLDNWEGDPTTATDLELIVEQTSRCRSILAELSQKRSAGDKNHFAYMAIEALLREAAAPHEARGAALVFDTRGEGEIILRRAPELIHAFRNIIENAVGFAHASVTIDTYWNEQELTISIMDDGPGFDPQIIKRVGEPYVTTRQPTPGKDGGLGLGLFIAKTLLERMGASVVFDSMPLGGACVTIIWQRRNLDEQNTDTEPE
ncbi:ActS/PrrB/RegB family redox-sensitive histidine kinase [Kordiimonas pumila]|uniref:histidine kinase n=1 Tax=Kordiimonas pumila TaxID=2161677 RepID=A0ABV7CZQ1_9PROT|nr:ActS/PrrB/RegB family redox-sensitive histidine kinase [Kordiimonas pumila]